MPKTIVLTVFPALACAFFGCGDTGPTAHTVYVHNPLAHPENGPPAGNPDGNYPIPAEAAPGDASNPDYVVGDGTPGSCTGEAFIQAVAGGGTITFNCGADPVTITLDRPAKVFNDSNPDIIIDGAGKVTLSGGGATRILYMNTCDPDQHWTTSHCQDQDGPRLAVQNLTFIDGDSRNETQYDGGGAIWVRGGRFKVVNCRFFNNYCDSLGPDVGGGAIYNDGNTMTLALYGCRIEYNSVNAYGSAIFFVTNDHTGDIHIENSVIRSNIGGSWYTLPGISMHSDTKKEIINSTIE